MVKKREPKAKGLEAFIESADGVVPELTEVEKRREPRKYKSITLHMNQVEYEQLQELAVSLDRSMLSTIRHAITNLAKNS